VYEAAVHDLQLHTVDGHWEQGPDTIELAHTVRILRHSRSKQWLEVDKLPDAGNYRHDLTLMAAATYVAEAGNDVRPHPTLARGGARPDMWIHTDSLSGPIEHKAPERLNEPAALTTADADRLVANVFKSARHQIGAVPFALVSVGGFRVPRALLDETRLAAERLFATGAAELKHVLGLLAFSVGLARKELPGMLPGAYGERHPGVGIHAALAVEIDPGRFDGLIVPRIARNPHYAGPVSIYRPGEPGNGFYLPFS